ncbi:unspecific monooxygenase, partial [Sarracenia purpurea var. burkii]
MLGNLPHRTLQDLAKTCGPIMSIRLGFVPAIVVSSPEATKLFLKTHDKTFANRPKRKASELMAYGSKSVAFLEYGPEWYGVRKLFNMELLSESKINSYVNMRATELNKLMESLKEAATACEVVDLSDMVWVFIEDTICRMLFGQRNDQRFDLKTIVQEGLALTGAFNIADFVPFLGVFDVQ